MILIYIYVLQALCGDVLPATLGRHKRVVSGQTMSLGEWPFLVSLHFLKPFPFTTRTHMQHLCGGALIHPRWVITAAHCVGFFEELRDVGNWRVALGEHNQYLKDLGEQIIQPEQFFIHPDFQPSKTNTLESDIALIKLSEEAFLTPYVGTISLNNHSAVTDNTKCQIGGWGQVASEPYGWGMYIPLKASLYIINNVTCSDVYAGLTYEDGEIYMKVDESVMCAGIPQNHQSQLQRDHGGNSDACNGDSGSPLVCPTGNAGEFEIAGIVSAGKGCGTGKYPGIYTKISYFYPWIAKIMKDN